MASRGNRSGSGALDYLPKIFYDNLSEVSNEHLWDYDKATTTIICRQCRTTTWSVDVHDINAKKKLSDHLRVTHNYECSGSRTKIGSSIRGSDDSRALCLQQSDSADPHNLTRNSGEASIRISTTSDAPSETRGEAADLRLLETVHVIPLQTDSLSFLISATLPPWNSGEADVRAAGKTNLELREDGDIGEDVNGRPAATANIRMPIRKTTTTSDVPPKAANPYDGGRLLTYEERLQLRRLRSFLTKHIRPSVNHIINLLHSMEYISNWQKEYIDEFDGSSAKTKKLLEVIECSCFDHYRGFLACLEIDNHTFRSSDFEDNAACVALDSYVTSLRGEATNMTLEERVIEKYRTMPYATFREKVTRLTGMAFSWNDVKVPLMGEP